MMGNLPSAVSFEINNEQDEKRHKSFADRGTVPKAVCDKKSRSDTVSCLTNLYTKLQSWSLASDGGQFGGKCSL